MLTAVVLTAVAFSIPQPRGHASTAEPQMMFAAIDRAIAEQVRSDIKSEKRRIEKLVGKAYPEVFVVELCPDRAAFDASLKKYAGIEKSTRKLLRATSNKDALELLGVAESDLLNRWRDGVLKEAQR